MAKLKSKGRWGGIPKEERSRIMKKLATGKQASLTPEERREHALVMVRAREKKRKLINKSK